MTTNVKFLTESDAASYYVFLTDAQDRSVLISANQQKAAENLPSGEFAVRLLSFGQTGKKSRVAAKVGNGAPRMVAESRIPASRSYSIATGLIQVP